MEDILSSPITWILLTALSEIIGQSKLKENSILALLAQAIKMGAKKARKK